MCQSLLLVTCDGEYFVFIDTTDLARLAAGEPALSYTDPGRAWHPVGDESSLHCFLLSVFSTVQFVHYASMGVYLGKVGPWAYVWKSPGRRKHVSFSLEGGIRVDLPGMREYSFLAAVFAILSYDNNWAYRRKGGHSQHHCG